MSGTVSENMVLRTVYLPKSLDQNLKGLAHRLALTKGELMRVLIKQSLDKMAAETKLHKLSAAELEIAKFPFKPEANEMTEPTIEDPIVEEVAVAPRRRAGGRV